MRHMKALGLTALAAAMLTASIPAMAQDYGYGFNGYGDGGPRYERRVDDGDHWRHRWDDGYHRDWDHGDHWDHDDWRHHRHWHRPPPPDFDDQD
ncbi:hypothetical protein [Lichenihabitans psoromatis]|uniref:hypothetical protein n=1 Tax=Lichenihabitans psoromatis TaxID=2528642 RepID=UPI001038446A|nr:hypothetical protein [Lichenihabitans psoromatis]